MSSEFHIDLGGRRYPLRPVSGAVTVIAVLPSLAFCLAAVLLMLVAVVLALPGMILGVLLSNAGV